MTNIKTVSQITNTVIHFNDKGNQFTEKTTKEKVDNIRNQLINEVEKIEIITNLLNEEIEGYTPKIESLGKIIEGLQNRINKGVENKEPLYIRQLASEYFDIEYNNKKLDKICENRSGICILLTKQLELKEKYNQMIKQCNAIK